MPGQQSSTSWLLSGKVSVAPASLGGALERIRREAARVDSEREALSKKGATAARVRSTLSNVIVLIVNQEQSTLGPAIDGLITELCIAHPSRFFIIEYLLGATGKNTISTGVSSRCVMTNAGLHVCSEEVYVEVPPDAVGVVRNLLLSLLVPDIDTVLFVGCDSTLQSYGMNGASAEGFAQLIGSLRELADVVLFDSSALSDFTKGVEAVTSGLQEDDRIAFRDINWHRTKRWRSLIAEQFEGERASTTAAQISGVRFSYPKRKTERGAGICSETLLLAGWFTSCLGWKVKGKPSASGNASSSGEGAAFELTCQDAQGSSPTLEFAGMESGEEVPATVGLLSVDIFFNKAAAQHRIKIVRNVATATAEISVEGAAGGNNSEIVMRRVPFSVEPLESIVISNLGSQRSTKDAVDVRGRSLELAGVLTATR